MTGGAANGCVMEEMGRGRIWVTNDSMTGSYPYAIGSQNLPKAPSIRRAKTGAETKAAYRFFQNQDVEAADIIETHRKKTAERAKPYKTILAIQDTSYFIYTRHTKTKGLGAMSLKKGKHVEKIFSNGLAQACVPGRDHGWRAVGTSGSEHICAQTAVSRAPAICGCHSHGREGKLPLFEALKNTDAIMGDTQVVTVCDREADMYGLFELGDRLKSPVLVRANVTGPSTGNPDTLKKTSSGPWSFMRDRPAAGTKTIEIPKRKATPHAKARNARTAILTIKFDLSCSIHPETTSSIATHSRRT